MSKDCYHLTITQDYQGNHILWFVQDRQNNFVDPRDLIRAKHKWADWVETFTFKGTVERAYGTKDIRNIMIFSDLSDALMVKLAFNSKQFE